MSMERRLSAVQISTKSSIKLAKERRRSSLTNIEEDAFLQVFEEIVEDTKAYPSHKDIEGFIEWMKRVVFYNSPCGAQISGRTVVSSYRCMADGVTSKELNLACVLGWCIEIFQACFIVVDDIMDKSEQRGGKPCWYLVGNNGLGAANDAFVLNGYLFFLLKRYFSHKLYYKDLIRLFHNIFFKTSLGQCADTKLSKNKLRHGFTLQAYTNIVKYKTSYYTFYLPIAAAMMMAGKTKAEEFKQVESLMMDLGHLFQVQDDYLDCFGDPRVTGKIGNDINENKCTWLIAMAYEKADATQKKILEENYGKKNNSRPENVKKVMDIFRELEIVHEYMSYEMTSYLQIVSKLEDLPSGIPKGMFRILVDLIYGREK